MHLIFSAAIFLFFAISPDIEHKITPIRLSENVLIFEENWGEGHMSVVATEEGIVVIDTFLSPRLARDARGIIEKEWPEKTIKYVIYTDWHSDHNSGNQVFADSTIIGNSKSLDRLRRDTSEDVASLHQMALEIEKRLEAERLDKEAWQYWNTRAKNLEQLSEDLKEFKFTHPSITLDHGGTLKCGGKTFVLFDFGPAHTDSDLVVFVPEEKLLITSDLVFNHRIPGIDIGWGGYILNNIASLAKMIELGDKVEHVVPGHGPIGDMRMVEKYKIFLQDLCDEVRNAISRGLTIEQAQQEIKLDKYSDYKDYRHQRDRVERIVEACWKMLERADSTAK